MSHEEIKDRYFNWLWSYGSGGPIDEYKSVWVFMCMEEFYDLVDMDSNRVTDGLELRFRFIRETSINIRVEDLDMAVGPCRFLEFFVGMCERMDDLLYDCGSKLNDAFWTLLRNCGLYDCSETNLSYRGGRSSRVQFDRIQSIIRNIVERRFDPDGVGGLFPCRTCPLDLRRLEWFQQMNLYYREHY